MILNLTKPRLYICQYMNGDIETSIRFMPGDNKIPKSEEKALLQHPGIRRKLDTGFLVAKNVSNEDLSKLTSTNDVKKGPGRPKSAANAAADAAAKAKAEEEAAAAKAKAASSSNR